MSYTPDFFLSENEIFRDKDYEAFLESFNDTYEKIARQVNAKDFAYYTTEEMVNGQRWYSDPQTYKTVYRKRIDIGALPNNTTKNTAHGITITANTIVTRLYGVATDPSTLFIPLPYLDMSGGSNHIQLSMDGTNIILISNADYSGFTSSYVIVEYIQG